MRSKLPTPPKNPSKAVLTYAKILPEQFYRRAYFCLPLFSSILRYLFIENQENINTDTAMCTAGYRQHEYGLLSCY